ncbi:hypothetical protein OGAPHI_000949 [Ogataea philodendri]|uniref:DUF4210 domain-containing protein n=1 Tax=Ogataea philodendri TaxID=1378263 RepID=A0A9P8PFC6_9ASCO|nr:uncharacterized protein OGAPHI_000949 [Ogataea philodendri]KAH3670434.1 hypothetical protein OGAPHI_000949 [Ogataea philodendri]
MSKRRSSLSQLSTLDDLEKFKVHAKSVKDSFRCFQCSKHTVVPTVSRRRRSSSSVVFSELLAPSEPLPFTMKMSVSSETYHKQLTLPFTASCLKDITDSPYFAEVNLNDYYMSQERKSPSRGSKRRFPGFQIPPKGTLQLIIYNNEKNVTSLLLFPYDVTSLRKDHKKVIKFRKNSTITYNSESNQDLKINVRKLHNELEFKAINKRDRKFYIFDSLKIAFVPGFLSENAKLPLSSSLPDFKKHQYNPKIPLFPQNFHTSVETVESDEYPVDMAYYTHKCNLCDNDSDDDECVQFPTFTYA